MSKVDYFLKSVVVSRRAPAEHAAGGLRLLLYTSIDKQHHERDGRFFLFFILLFRVVGRCTS